MATQALLVTPLLLPQRPLLSLASYAAQALLVYNYVHAVSTPPAMLPGAKPDYPTSRVSNPVWVQSHGWCGTRRRRGVRRRVLVCPRGAYPLPPTVPEPTLPYLGIRTHPPLPHGTRTHASYWSLPSRLIRG